MFEASERVGSSDPRLQGVCDAVRPARRPGGNPGAGPRRHGVPGAGAYRKNAARRHCGRNAGVMGRMADAGVFGSGYKKSGGLRAVAGFRELLTRLELVTSSLPRKCSTTELQQYLSCKSARYPVCRYGLTDSVQHQVQQ